MSALPKLTSIEFLGGYRIRGHLTDGTTAELDLTDHLQGPLLEPLRDERAFRKAYVDDTGTLCWPNGADLAPEAWVHGLPASESRAPSNR